MKAPTYAGLPLAVLALLHVVNAQVSDATSTITGSVTIQTSPPVAPSTSSEAVDSPTPTSESAESTASPTSTLAPDALVGLDPVPVSQSWCQDPIYCAGEILNTVELAGVFPDSKTFPDKPTRLGLNETLTAWQQLSSDGNVTYFELESFLNDYFNAEGTELVAVQIDPSYNASATPFLSTIEDDIVRGFEIEVMGYWADLIRETNNSVVCQDSEDCDSTLIPLNHTVVVPGGRYREVYYWDSFWILEGLLHSGLAEYANNVLLNFMDEIETYGYIPNGGRKYYLNRSQPPVFTQMLAKYVEFTGNTTILERALPLADKEFEWWSTNRTTTVVSPYTNTTHAVSRYNVFVNTAPRPEGYVEDYETVNLSEPALNETEAEALYVELASGAESGWDYTARWMKEPLKNVSDPYAGLRSLNIKNIIPIELNALLTSNHYKLADLYDQYASVNTTANSTNITSRADLHRQQGDQGKAAILDLMWDSEKVAFYDFNLTSNARNDFFSLAAFFPYWLDIIPPEVETDEVKAVQAFAGLNYIVSLYNGSVPATLVPAGLNWDFPNAWPNLQYVLAEALDKLNASVTTTPYASLLSYGTNDTSLWSLIPAGQLGLNETDLPAQTGGPAVVEPFAVSDNSTSWRDALQFEIVNRYIAAAFCSWYSTGGSLPGVLEQLPAAELNVTNSSPVSTGQMFEKFNATDLDAAGGGGEYEVVTGFGWTNGVVIYFGAKYGANLTTPNCPAIDVQEVTPSNTTLVNAHRVFAGSRVPRS